MPSSKVIVGFIPLLDCATLVAAREQGFAAEAGIDLVLARETSWANIRDRTIVGHFDAAHMLGPMTVASTLGIGHVTVPLIAPIALGLGGNAITVSTALWEQMVRHGAAPGASPAVHGEALRQVVSALKTSAAGRALTFGMVYPFSCHNYELRYWLSAVGIDPDRDVRLVVIPPPLLVDAMRAGQIDGFCVGEPWNSVAVECGAGAIVMPTTAIWERSPEKVLGCRAEWAEKHPEQLAALIRAIHRASRWCEDHDNHRALAKLLAEPKYVGAPAELLYRALSGQLALLPGAAPATLTDFFVTAKYSATHPWPSHALWFYEQMVRWGQTPFAPNVLEQVRATYRPDLYRQALGIESVEERVEAFFDCTGVVRAD